MARPRKPVSDESERRQMRRAVGLHAPGSTVVPVTPLSTPALPSRSSARPSGVRHGAAERCRTRRVASLCTHWVGGHPRHAAVCPSFGRLARPRRPARPPLHPAPSGRRGRSHPCRTPPAARAPTQAGPTAPPRHAPAPPWSQELHQPLRAHHRVVQTHREDEAPARQTHRVLAGVLSESTMIFAGKAFDEMLTRNSTRDGIWSHTMQVNLTKASF
ncbi:hypothetical protein BS78_08G069100 [Paspalum vaginatum]|nr:hypothetical protein BS78_08G069100 [Paspalum vaginatum]